MSTRDKQVMPDVLNNAAQKRFELDTGEGLAVADYRLSQGVMTIYHTHVPAALRERGVGSALVRGALEDVRRRGFKVVPRCWFVSEFITDNPEFSDLLA